MGAKVMPFGEIGGFKFNISVAIFLMPFLYTIIDCISEVYGRARARGVVFLGLICIVLLMAFMALAIALPHAARFDDQNPSYEMIFGTSFRLALASVSAFFVSELTDVFVYSKIRAMTKGKIVWLRNNVSNIVGELVDSLVFMTIAFYSFDKGFVDNARWVLGLTIPYWIAKCIMSFVSTPLVYAGIKYLQNGKKTGRTKMKVEGIKTDRISVGGMKTEEFLDKYIERVAEETVIVFSSKIIGILEGRAVPIDSIDKDELIIRESDAHLDRSVSPYGNMFTINKNTLISAGGIDESNAGGHYILWPENPMKSAERIRDFLVKKFNVKKLGIIISDSTVMPLRRGTVGIMIGWSGFEATKNLIGTKDLFGREFKISTVAVGSNLAATGNTVMGEGAEQTPISVLTDIPFIDFLDRSHITDAEYKECFVEPKEDLFAPFLMSHKWKKK
jgi:uncharacterized integral membrane protein (TIGR00697 family)